MSEKVRTRKELLAEIVRLSGEIEQLRAVHRSELERRDRAEIAEKHTRAQFADLKERVANAESENQRLRGYVQRVQEDDVVREELVVTGEPGVEQRLVPKRKSTVFAEPLVYASLDGSMGGACNTSSYVGRERDRPRPRHWVNY